MNNEMLRSNFPEKVGILAMEVYFPTQLVDQRRLEEFDRVSSGKYTIGLGQSKMSFCLDNEDINSICLTVLDKLMQNYSIKPEQIGRLDVGTETLIDKSKSVKSVLMKLFEESGNTDVEGVDNLNACFGGTAAIYNSINWIESSYWDGRYAAVVMGDIALYAKGSARPTGGAGAVAFLIGPNAPIVFERGLRASHIAHAFDFYKPVMDSEYPVVDGKLSVTCYLNALDKCYQLYKKKYRIVYPNDLNNNASKRRGFDRNLPDAFLFHSPYCKLVQKSFARLLWNDYLELKENSDLDKYRELSTEETFVDKNLEKDLMKLSGEGFNKKTSPSLLFAKEIGNMYTPSLYACLASFLISKPVEELKNNTVCLFSYGSGLASSMYSLRICNESTHEKFTLEKIVANLNEKKRRLEEERVEVEPKLYDAYLKQRELTNKRVPRESQHSADSLYPGTWYLKSVDASYRRVYARRDNTSQFDVKQAAQLIRSQLTQLDEPK